MSHHSSTLFKHYNRCSLNFFDRCITSALYPAWPHPGASLHPDWYRANTFGWPSSSPKLNSFTSCRHDGTYPIRNRLIQTTSPKSLPLPQSRRSRRRLPDTHLTTSETHSPPSPGPTLASLHLTPNHPRLPRRRPRPASSRCFHHTTEIPPTASRGMITGQLLPIQPEGRARTVYPDGWEETGAQVLRGRGGSRRQIQVGIWRGDGSSVCGIRVVGEGRASGS